MRLTFVEPPTRAWLRHFTTALSNLAATTLPATPTPLLALAAQQISIACSGLSDCSLSDSRTGRNFNAPQSPEKFARLGRATLATLPYPCPTLTLPCLVRVPYWLWRIIIVPARLPRCEMIPIRQGCFELAVHMPLPPPKGPPGRENPQFSSKFGSR
jgi:hypothetical protein